MSEIGTALVAISSSIAALYSVEKGQIWRSSGPSDGSLTNAAWLKNGRAFLVSHKGGIRLHILESNDADTSLLSFPGEEVILRISGDGKTLVLASSSAPGALHVYDLPALLGKAQGPPNTRPTVLRDHDQPIVAIATSPTSPYVATSTQAGSVYLHEVAPGGRATTIAALPCGAALVVPKRCLAFSNSNPLRLAAGTDDGQVLVWQLGNPTIGPVVQQKLSGRIMGVGFGTYGKGLSSVLVGCSEEGSVCITDLQRFPKQGESITSELSAKASCMALRDDGLVVAVGTKDGKVGVSKLDELIKQRQNKGARSWKVFDMGTHLNVSDIAFQRSSSRDMRDSREGSRDSKEGALAAAAAPQPPATTSSTEAAADAGTQGGAAVAGPGPGAPPALREATNQYAPRVGVLRQPGSGGADGGVGVSGQAQLDLQDAKVGRAANPTASAAAGTVLGQRQQRHMDAPGVGPGSGDAPQRAPSPAPLGARSSEPASSQAYGSAPTSLPATKAGRPPGVPHLEIPGPAMPSAGQMRSPDAIDGAGIGSVEAQPLPGPAAAEGAAGPDAAGVPSPASRAPTTSASPSISPSRLRSPRVSMAGQMPASIPAPLVRNPGGAGAPSFADMFAQLRADIRSDVREEVRHEVVEAVRQEAAAVRQEVKRLVHGLHTDMVRQGVAGEAHTEEQVAVLRLENQQLREELRQLREQVELVIRFGMLSQQRMHLG